MTYDPIPYAQPAAGALVPNNQSGGLIAFGVISILIGAAAACGAIVTGIALVAMPRMGAAAEVPWGPVILGGVLYLLVSVVFVWVGIDSIRCRRWVRPMVIALGWLTMVGSVFAITGMITAMIGSGGTINVAAPAGPTAATAAATGPTATPGPTTTVAVAPVTGMVLIGPVAMLLVLGVMLPGGFVWFYARPAVRATLEAYDPGPSWTERCPLPVFVACVVLFVGGVFSVPFLDAGAKPVFGAFAGRGASAALGVAAAVSMIASAVLMYRGRRAGWWLALAVIALEFGSSIVTMLVVGTAEYQRQTAGSPPGEAAASPLGDGPVTAVFVVLSAVVSVGLLLWIRKWFDRPDAWRGRA